MVIRQQQTGAAVAPSPLWSVVVAVTVVAASTMSEDIHAQLPLPRAQALAVQELVVRVTLNGVVIAEGLEVTEVNGLGILLSQDAFRSLKLVNVKPLLVQRGNMDLVALSRTPGVSAALDRPRQELVLQTAAAVLPVTRLSVPPPVPVATSVTPGAYVNYDATSTRTSGRTTSTAYVEGVAFSNAGSVTSQALVTQGSDATLAAVIPGSAPPPSRASVIRLDTYAQRDFPATGARLRIGDSITASGTYGPAVRFGGLQFGTEDVLDPRLVTLPTIGFSGQASVPSSVDVFMNSGNLRQFTVPAGAFNIENVPTVTGAGVARMVVRDSLARETVVEQPFFSLPTQLRAGLSRYSMSGGWLRNNFGLRSNDYGSPFLAGLWRYGLSNYITVETRAEAQRNGPSGAGASVLLPMGGKQAVTLSGAASRSDGKSGVATSVTYQYVHSWFNFGLQGEWRSADYQLIGSSAQGASSFSKRTLANLGMRLGDHGSLGLVFGGTEDRLGAISRYASATYSLALNQEWRLSMGYNRSSGASSSQMGYVGVNWLGSTGLFAGTTANAQCDIPCLGGVRYDGTVTAGSRSGNYEAFNWDVASNRTRGRAEAEWLTSNVALNAAVARDWASGGSDSWRVGARGSVVYMDRTVAFGRYVNDGVIMVKAPEAAGLPILTNGSRGGRLDSRGVAVLTRFTPYQQVNVALEPEAMPLDLVSDGRAPPVATQAKSGTLARINARKLAPATFTLIDRQGKAISTGVVVFFGGATNKVGLDGLVYVENIANGGAAYARKNGSRCDFVIPAPPRGDLQPYLGALTCELRHL